MFWIILMVFVCIVVGALEFLQEGFEGVSFSGLLSSVLVFLIGLTFSSLLMNTVPSTTKTDIKTYKVISDTIFCDTVCYIDEENVIRDCSKYEKVISDDGTFFEIVTTSPKNEFWFLPFVEDKKYTLYIDSSLLLNESEVIK